jgi:uncharacterized protein YndB with AHSA1/START domain
MSETNLAPAKYDTAITADPDVPAIRIERIFDATPEQLFRAHTDPELVAQWLGPVDLAMEVVVWDCRTGGEYRYIHRRTGDEGLEEYPFHGCFHEVSPGRLVQTFTFEGWPEGVALETMTFDDLGDGRTKLSACSLVGSFTERDQMLASGMDTGINQGYQRLDALLEGGHV